MKKVCLIIISLLCLTVNEFLHPATVVSYSTDVFCLCAPYAYIKIYLPDDEKFDFEVHYDNGEGVRLEKPLYSEKRIDSIYIEDKNYESFVELIEGLVAKENESSEDSLDSVKSGVYTFYDGAVKNTVEQYFNKNADELTTEDLDVLKNLPYFVVEGRIDKFDDLPQLVPNLKYLYFSIDKMLTSHDYEVLDSITELKAISIYSTEIVEPNLGKDMLYAEIAYNEADTYLIESNNLASFSILDENFILENIKCNISKYIKIIDNGKIYELFSSDYIEKEFFYEKERKVFVSEKSNGALICESVLDFTSEIGAAADERIYLLDVDFDGNKDILVDNGHFGNQGAVTYTCYLKRNEGYERCESFESIPNPSIDTEGEKILGTWRNGAASHSNAMYSFNGSEFVMTYCLTEEADSKKQNGEIIWIYKVEQFSNGELIKTDYYSTEDYSEEFILDMFFEENNYWQLFSDKSLTSFKFTSPGGFE